MALIFEGFHTYTPCSDGQRIPITAEHFSFKIAGTTLYEFEKATGVLKAAISPAGLELIVGEIPLEGKDLLLPIPFSDPIYLAGIKRVESIEPYLLRVESIESDKKVDKPETPKSIF